MLTKYNFYEGVPVGSDNFSDFYNTIFKNSDAMMTLAFASGGTTEVNVMGGHLQSNPVDFKLIRSSTGTYFYVLSSKTASSEIDDSGATVFSPDNSKGIIFGRTGKRYFTSEIPYIRSPGTEYGTTDEIAVEDLTVSAWETIATGFDTELYLDAKKLVYTANIPLNPYRIIKEYNKSAAYPTYKIEQGVMDLRYNGIPQSQVNSYDMRLYTPVVDSITRYAGNAYTVGSNGTTNRITLEGKLFFGAEHPQPMYKGKYQFGTVEGLDRAGWLASFGTDNGKYVELRFPFANFTSEQAHIIVRRSNDVYYDNPNGVPVKTDPIYLHLQEDSSGGNEVQDGFFKVMDRAKGVIRVNVSQTLLLAYLRNKSQETISDIRYTIVCPEQLLESLEENTTIKYRSRYGKVFTGTYLDTEIVSISYESTTGRFGVNRITEGINIEDGTDVIYVDRTSSVKTVLLAIRYPAKVKIESEPQKLKYVPDTISMYYVSAVPVSGATSASSVATVSDIVTFVEVNKASWYNQDVKNREYKPVPRAERATLSLASNLAVIGNGARDGTGMGGEKLSKLDPLNPIFRYNSGPSANFYTYAGKVAQNVGVLEEYVRRDAALPEPHYINSPIVKMFLASGETLNITEGHQMSVRRKYTIQSDALLIVNGMLIVD